MHTVELLEQALAAAHQAGFTIRHEWLDGSEGGPCEFGGRRWLFIDLSLSTAEQLAQAISALQIAQPSGSLPAPLVRLLEPRRAA